MPATTALAGTSLVTTLPAPTMAFSPTVTPQSKVAPDPMDAPRLTRVGVQAQSDSVLQLAIAIGGPGIAVVDESNVVANKDIVFQGDSLTDESMARNLAAIANLDPFLNLHEGPNLHVVPDFTTVKIGKIVDANIFSQPDIGSNPLIRLLWG